MSQEFTATNGPVTVTSTSATQEEVNEAAGLTADGKTATQEAPGSEKVEGTPEQKTGEVKQEKKVEESKEEAEEDTGAEEDVLPAWARKRVARARAQRDKANSKAQQLEAELEEIRARSAEKVPAEPPKVYEKDEPKPEDFETTEAYIKAQARWEVRQELAEQKANDEKAVRETKDRETLDTYAKRLNEAKAKHDDWDEVYETVDDISVHPSVQLALIKRKDGPELVYHLAKNPELAKQLYEMDPLEAVSELGFIAASIANSSRSSEPAPVKKSVSTAPAPIKPVGGAGTKSQVPLDQMPMSDYIAARKAGRTA